MSDLTIIYLTRYEHPPHWQEFHWQKLLQAAGNHKILTVSPDPLAHVVDDQPQSHWNMYRQLLKASKLATTPFIATAESDTLYPKEHFNFYRPPLDSVAYDMSRWSLYTWGTPIYSVRRRISNCTLIAPREYLIAALEERYGDNALISKEKSLDRVGEVGRHIHERALGLTLRNAKQVWCEEPTVQVNHPNGTNFHEAHHPTRKRLGEIKALEIPVWGRAEDLIKEYR